MLHASNYRTSNTLALWSRVRDALAPSCDITEIALRNGTMEDCSGCPYTMCLHFGEQGGCFYGGVMVQEVYPAIREADALVMLCPNYNDAVSANLTACINRLTALYRTTSFERKALYGIVVSGYSGATSWRRSWCPPCASTRAFGSRRIFACWKPPTTPARRCGFRVSRNGWPGSRTECSAI